MMDIFIAFEENPTVETSLHLRHIANLIERDCDAVVQVKTGEPRPGEKDGGLSIAIAVLGLALSGVSTLLSVLSYWRSEEPKYSLTITRGDRSVSIDNLSQKQFDQILDQLAQSNDQSTINVLIADES